jgi:Cu/Ag efflux pump CusA
MLPVVSLREYGNEYIVTGVARTSDPAEIGKSVVKSTNGVPVTIADVAEVKIGSAVKIGEGSMNGTPAVIMTVMKQPNTNTLVLTEQIERSLTDLSGQLPAGVKVNTQIFRQADFIEASIGNIQKTLYEGMIFVIVVLLVFLANLRATFISLLAIPISLVVAILTLKWLGFTINTMSLGGMAIAIGNLVDDAIIDVENVFRRLKENAQRPQAERRATWTSSMTHRWKCGLRLSMLLLSLLPRSCRCFSCRVWKADCWHRWALHSL